MTYESCVASPGWRALLTASGIAAAVWSHNLGWERTRTLKSRFSCCHRPTAAIALRSYRTAHPTPASPVWSTVVPPTLTTVHWTPATQPCTATTGSWMCMETLEACPTWSSTILGVPTSSVVTPAPTWSPMLTERTCMRMKLKAITTSTLPTRWMVTMDTTDLGITAATEQTVSPRIHTQQWGRHGPGRGPEMNCWPKTCKKLWWRNIWKAGTTGAKVTGREEGQCSLDTTLTAALSSAWATRPCQRPSATPAEPPHYPLVSSKTHKSTTNMFYVLLSFIKACSLGEERNQFFPVLQKKKWIMHSHILSIKYWRNIVLSCLRVWLWVTVLLQAFVCIGKGRNET